MIPPLEPDGHLPAGEHVASWAEIAAVFAGDPWRIYLLEGFRRACRALATAGCTRVWLDGSFVTNKDVPGDFDGCWDEVGVDPNALDPVLLDFDNKRAAQKAKYGGELFPATFQADIQGRTFVQFFQMGRNGEAKGVLVLDPRSAP